MRILIAIVTLFLPLQSWAQNDRPRYPERLSEFARSNEQPVPAKELAAFLGPVPLAAITWTSAHGIDSRCYYGRANPPLAGDLRIAIDPYGHFEPGPKSAIAEGKLGNFTVQWHRKVLADGTIQQRAVLSLDDRGHGKAHLLLEAKRQQDIDELLKILSPLPLFEHSPQGKH